MIKVLCSLLLSIFFVNASAQKVISDANVELRSVPDFHAIDVSNSFNVILTQGAEAKVAVSAQDAERVKNITTNVENGVLMLRFKDEKFWKGNNKLTAYISVNDLDAIKASGACDITFYNSISVKNLLIQLSGACDMKGEVNVAEKLYVHLNGASDVVLKGAADYLNIDASGASDVKAYDLIAGSGNIKASGASDIKLTVEKELSVDASGASNIFYQGNAITKEIKTSGASSVKKR